MTATNNTATQTTTPITSGACPTSAGAAGLLGSLTPVLLILLVFYFLLMRPQQKRDAKRREMINAVKRDDKVLTTGGIIGRVHKILNEKEIVMEVSEGIRMRFLKSAISDVLEKGSDIGKDESEIEKVAGKEEKTSDKKENKKSMPKRVTKNKSVAKKK